jgi:tetratricopeptide (TPR) repeat protein
MTGKEFKDKTAQIQELLSSFQFDQAGELTLFLIQDLFQERKFAKIVELFYSDFCDPRENFYTFEVAYALSEAGYLEEAENIYESLLQNGSVNSAILNNLSHIKESKNQLKEAFELIRQAYELDPHDEVIAGNYLNLLALIQKQEAIQQTYQKAGEHLQDEQDFVIEKLKTLVKNLKQEEEFQNYRMTIPPWKFSVLMETNSQQAELLKHQWLEKGYLRDTGQRGAQLIPIYELNPFLEEELYKIQRKEVPVEWVEGVQELTVENLERFSYFSTLHKIRKIKGRYRDIAERDLNELFLNYLMKNEKAVIILSGSLVEAVLMYYCEEKEITYFYQQRKNKTVKRDLYDSDLGEILSHLQEKKILSDVNVHVGNIARIYRNFIHPGRELREPELLSQSKSNLCFISALEIVNALLS